MVDPIVDTVRGLSSVIDEVLAQPPTLGHTRLICVDGPSGAGKTVLAGRLTDDVRSRGVDAGLVHMDDLYEGWGGLPTVGRRLTDWILRPLRSGQPGRYRRYDWYQGDYAEWHRVPAAPVVIIEGVGSGGQVVTGAVTRLIWVDAAPDIRFQRCMARDGAAYRPYWSAWAAAERDHFALHHTCERADLWVDGAAATPHDPATELVVRG